MSTRNAAAVARWKARNPHKARAHQEVAKAKRRGQLKPQPCQKCGKEKAEAHHPDPAYSDPLKVDWLCKIHHAEVHRRQRRAAS